MSVNTEKTVQIMCLIAKALEENKQYLSDLDQAIGDGDHGFNMARGFAAVEGKVTAKPPVNVGDVVKTTAMALISNVGGASGPLYGSFFMKMATKIGAQEEIGLAQFAPAFRDGVAAVQARGKAVPGEKTMIDVLLPVGDLLEMRAAEGAEGKAALCEALALAEKCRDATKDIVATKGRASYLGERSLGHIDPGAASACLMLKTLVEAL